MVETGPPIADAFATLFERSPLPAFVYDPETIAVVAVNEAALSRYGYTRDEFLRLTIEDLRPAEERPGFRDRVSEHVSQRTNESGPWTHQTRTGEMLRVRMISHWVRFEGRPARLVTVLDVTAEERVKQALAASELKFAAAFETSPTGTALVTLDDSRFVEANQSFLEAVDLDREAVIGRTLDESVVLSAPTWRSEVQDALKHGRGVRDLEVPFTTRTGRSRAGIVSAEPVSLNGDRYALVQLKDVTAQKRAEQALRDSEEQFRTLMEHAADAFVLHDANGIIHAVNRATCRSLGYTEDELIGASISTFVVGVDPDHVIGDRLAACGPGEALQRDSIHRRKDGTEFPVEARVGWLRLGDEPLVLAIARDITDRREAEAAIRESERRYHDLVEHAAQGIARTSHDGRFLAANPAMVRMLGYDSEDELKALDLARDVYADTADRDAVLSTYRDSRTPYETEARWRRRDGSIITVRMSGRMVTGPGGMPNSYEFFAEDVTDRRALEAQLRQAQKMDAVGQLTGGIAHDFNNILTVVLAQADLLAAGLDGQPDLRADVLEVQKAARRGADLIRKLLTFSRNDQLEFRPTSLPTVVGDVNRMLSRLLPETIAVTLEPSDDVPPVRADHGAVEQIIMNLATNARDAMPGGGAIMIAMRRERFTAERRGVQGWGDAGDYARLTVRDTGCGMDARTRARIFEPFFTTKAAGRGTGLGMAMIYGLMKQHGGYVDVESEVGRGTSVHLYFPACDAPDRVDEHATRADEPLVGGSETILLVEDEDELRRTADRILRSLGYAVVLARDGQDALELLRDPQVNFDLVISDLVMPRLGGRDLHRWIREQQLPTRMLLTSGYAPREAGDGGRLDPSIPFLRKPWTLSELAGAVRAVMDGP